MNDDFAFKLDYIFDGDSATVQRAKSPTHLTARDILSIETVERAFLSAWYSQPYWSEMPA